MKVSFSSQLLQQCLNFLFLTILAYPHATSGQEYNFNFYNGDVNQTVDPEGNAIETKTKPVLKPTKQATDSQIEQKIESDPEKLKRTGLAIIAGYNRFDYRDSTNLFNNIENHAYRAGISLISSYDFNLDLEFISNSIKGSFYQSPVGERFEGTIPGLSISGRQHYWLSENVGLALSGSLRGMKGTVESNYSEYAMKSYGVSASFGPTLKFDKFQLLFAYEFGVDHFEVNTKNEIYEFNNNRWVQSSALKGLISYRF